MHLKAKPVKVTLIASHQVSFSTPLPLHLCVGVHVLAASLRQRGIHCQVVDLAEFHILYHRDFEEVFKSITNKIMASQPDILGFSTMNNSLPIALELSKRIKKRYPDIFIVLGGPGASFSANGILEEFPHVGAIIRGEADTALPDFIESLSTTGTIAEIKGLVYRKYNSIIDHGWPVPIDRLDDLPIPAYEAGLDITWEKNVRGEYGGYILEVGRGCPYKCSFCTTSSFFNRKFRMKSVERIIKEIQYIREKIRDKPVIFLHDLLTFNHSFIEQLCEELKRRVPNLTWECYSRLDTIDESILKKMQEAGCYKLLIGIEVGTERMQRMINKNIDLTRFDHIMDILKKLGYNVRLSFIVGFPFEEPSDIISLFSFAMRARVIFRDKAEVLFGTLGPEKSTPLYESWKHTLAYDEYGLFPGINLPVRWNKLEQMVKDNPDIFYLLHHYRVSPTRRTNAIKYVLLGYAVNAVMKNSLVLAYMALGDQLIKELINKIDRIELPSLASIHKGDYLKIMDSLHQLVYEILKPDPILAGKFDALARYELAIMEISRQRAGMNMKVIRVNYDPISLMTALESSDGVPGDDKIQLKGELYCMLIEDEEQKIKCTTIPRVFANQFLNRNSESQ